MTTLAWIVHNNTSYISRILIAGLNEIGGDPIDHIAAREDLIGLRDAVLPHDPTAIGAFPDSPTFIPSLATEDFWDRLPDSDHIIFTVNAGDNHNAARAAAIIRRKKLWHKLIYIDDDERGHLHPDYRDMFLRARIAFMAFRPRLHQLFSIHPHVVWLGFAGVEPRFARFVPDDLEGKNTSVFFRGRGPHRAPFIEALSAAAIPHAKVMPELEENQEHSDHLLAHITGNRHNISYYKMLADSKVAVYLNGYNPLGYQFWENIGLKAVQVMQSPKATRWYSGGHYPTDRFDCEFYDAPFEPGTHFLSFESPEEMVERVRYLLEHDAEREKMAEAAYDIAAQHHTSRARAERFLTYLHRDP